MCHAEGKSLYQQQRYSQKKSEDCAWTPVVDEELLKFLESDEHKAGWIPYQNSHAQVSLRAKALRAPDPYYTSKQYFFRTSVVKRKGVWWLLEMDADTRKEKNLISLKEEAEILVVFCFLLKVHILHLRHNSHLKLLKNCWIISWVLCMVVALKEGRPLVCVACMLMTFLSLVLQIFWRSSKGEGKLQDRT